MNINDGIAKIKATEDLLKIQIQELSDSLSGKEIEIDFNHPLSPKYTNDITDENNTFRFGQFQFDTNIKIISAICTTPTGVNHFVDCIRFEAVTFKE